MAGKSGKLPLVALREHVILQVRESSSGDDVASATGILLGPEKQPKGRLEVREAGPLIEVDPSAATGWTSDAIERIEDWIARWHKGMKLIGWYQVVPGVPEWHGALGRISDLFGDKAPIALVVGDETGHAVCLPAMAESKQAVKPLEHVTFGEDGQERNVMPPEPQAPAPPMVEREAEMAAVLAGGTAKFPAPPTIPVPPRPARDVGLDAGLKVGVRAAHEAKRLKIVTGIAVGGMVLMCGVAALFASRAKHVAAPVPSVAGIEEWGTTSMPESSAGSKAGTTGGMGGRGMSGPGMGGGMGGKGIPAPSSMEAGPAGGRQGLGESGAASRDDSTSSASQSKGMMGGMGGPGMPATSSSSSKQSASELLKSLPPAPRGYKYVVEDSILGARANLVPLGGSSAGPPSNTQGPGGRGSGSSSLNDMMMKAKGGTSSLSSGPGMGTSSRTSSMGTSSRTGSQPPPRGGR